ncbi:hypothetical protein K437DRAFT_233471 [Tilletiaria anomala UBC 951]|uniref:Dihydroorotate dehydrogenase (quinone), mitochondrial n=1 Tax=Tilletiaria anomala (strain ATCC 24038 / CBS 436.72 / UBC 951) TaxID=1037660 RepID=A0A066WIK9_TILAU|nr:uncharacterized protein K437DRAFT_233471 [Tilletiaria anomala UBC 951]KDN50839.1 hypothetical protein K437DRAFT_233471 [Tilletiaria anomala UBC 951]
MAFRNPTVALRFAPSRAQPLLVLSARHPLGRVPARVPTIQLQHFPAPSSSRTLFTRRGSPSRLRSALTTTVLVVGGVFFAAYYVDSRSAIHRWVTIPFLKATTDPETAQKLAIRLCASGIAPRDLIEDDDVLKAEIFGKKLSNPIGLAAGFDKQAEAIDGLLDLGFGIVEIGSVTPEPQPGNPQPRYFRLVADNAVINRFGFNSEGHVAILGRLRDRIRRWLLHESNVADMSISSGSSRQTVEKLLASHPDSAPRLVDAAGLPRSLREGKLLSINLGKNKISAEQDVSDYVKGVHKLGPYADMIVVNVSSPNTPGLRRLQRRGVLQDLLKQVVFARDEMLQNTGTKLRDGKPGLTTPLLVKIAPDLDEVQLQDVADAVMESGVDGIIVSNTTIQRPTSLISTNHIHEAGGLSGPPLKPLSLKALTAIRERVGSELTIIGCGGIYTAQDALDFAKAGANAVQLYTSFGYEGVGHPRRLKDELTALLKQEGMTWMQVVGSGIDLSNLEETKGKNYTELKDLYRRNVASIKSQMEDLRLQLGGSAKTNITALPYFQPDPADTDYVTLLERVHEVLGSEPGWVQDDALGRGRRMTAGEEIDAMLDDALRDPKMSAHAAVLPSGVVGEGEEAISAAPEYTGKGSLEAKVTTRVGVKEMATSAWESLVSSASGSGATAAAPSDESRRTLLVGMDGTRPDFKAADKLRVV